MGCADASAFSRCGRPVLLLDSKDWDRAAIAAAVERAGLVPRTAATPERALVQLSRPEEHVEAVLVPEDWQGVSMPEFVAEIRALRPGLPIIETSVGTIAAAIEHLPKQAV